MVTPSPLIAVTSATGDWLATFLMAVVLGTVVYSRLIRPSRPRR